MLLHICGLVEEGLTPHASVKNVEDHYAGNLTNSTRHDTTLQTLRPTVKLRRVKHCREHLEASDAVETNQGPFSLPFPYFTVTTNPGSFTAPMPRLAIPWFKD